MQSRIKAPPAYANKAYREKSGITPFILNLGTTRKWLTSRLGSLTPRERATGTHSTTNCVGPKAHIEVLEKIKKNLALVEKRTPSHKARILVTILITLLRLLY